MSDISAATITSLRKRTGVSIMECKKALEEAGGDEEKAIEILRKRGAAQAAKKADREQSEGSVFVAEGSGKAAAVMLRCETDFVARDENFIGAGNNLAKIALEQGADAAKAEAETVVPALVQKLGENITLGTIDVVEAAVIGSYVHSNSKIGVIIGLDGGSTEAAKDVAMHAAAMSPSFTSPEEVTAEEVEKEKEIWKEQLSKEGKPADIMEKIMMGKEKKFREENALISQPFVKNPEQSIEKYLDGAKVVSYVRIATA